MSYQFIQWAKEHQINQIIGSYEATKTTISLIAGTNFVTIYFFNLNLNLFYNVFSHKNIKFMSSKLTITLQRNNPVNPLPLVTNPFLSLAWTRKYFFNYNMDPLILFGSKKTFRCLFYFFFFFFSCFFLLSLLLGLFKISGKPTTTAGDGRQLLKSTGEHRPSSVGEPNRWSNGRFGGRSEVWNSV